MDQNDPQPLLPTSGASPVHPLALTGRQRAVHDALSKRDKRLSDMYMSALMVLSQENNPYRIQLGAHALREMMERLPEFIDIARESKPPGVKAKAIELKVIWDKCKKKSELAKSGAWEGQIDLPTREYLSASERFFGWLATENDTRYERNAALVRALDPSEHKLPPILEKHRVTEWKQQYDYFASLAHFNSAEDFESWQEALERRIIELLIPRTFEDQVAIEDLIKQAETP